MKKKFIISFILPGIIIGLLVAFQFKTSVPAGGRFLTSEMEAKDNLLKEYLDEQLYLKSRIVTLRKSIEEAQDALNDRTQSVNIQLLDELKKSLGLTEISGDGIEITLNDNPSIRRTDAEIDEANLVQASDLRDIVNILNAASSEGISINNQRVIATSPIISVGSSILVNNSHIAPPFTISAVGDKDLIIQRLLNNPLLNSLYSRRKKSNIGMEIIVKKSVLIPVYSEDLNAENINLVE
jgi:uncharacterized protein YlxW (UPF0749 family)